MVKKKKITQLDGGGGSNTELWKIPHFFFFFFEHFPKTLFIFINAAMHIKTSILLPEYKFSWLNISGGDDRLAGLCCGDDLVRET